MEKQLGKQTSFFLSDEIRRQIQAKGMTISGAFLAGWEAIQDRVKYASRIEELEADNREMGKNIRSMQRMLAENFAEMEELRKQHVEHR